MANYALTTETQYAAPQASVMRIAQRLDQSKVSATPEIVQRYFAISEQLVEDVDNFRGAYKTLQTPVLVISGDNDISFAVENWFPLFKNAPTLQHIIFPATGHAPHFKYPELSTTYINSVINNTNN